MAFLVPVLLLEAHHFVKPCLSGLSSELSVIVQSNYIDENMDVERGLVVCSEPHSCLPLLPPWIVNTARPSWYGQIPIIRSSLNIKL